MAGGVAAVGQKQSLRIRPDSGHPSSPLGVRIIGVAIRTYRRPLPCPTSDSESIMAACISIHIRTQRVRLITVISFSHRSHRWPTKS